MDKNLINQIGKILGGKKRKFAEAPARDPNAFPDVMRYKSGQWRYEQDGEHLTGLNLANTGLTDKKWQQILNLLGPDVARLRALNLSDNELMQFSFPADMPALQWVNLSDNAALEHVSFSVALPGLERLDMSGCKVEVIEFVNGFDALKNLDLSHNTLTQLKFREGLPQLENLDLSHNQLKSIDWPEGFRRLKHLYLQHNQL